jgi:histidinol dehydrogenase
MAALAYGTQSIPSVDKIVGPGNLYVACAKRFVFGAVAIDSIAGPSEILVVADDEADPRLIAADLLSQAEHDEAVYPLLVCASLAMAQAVAREITLQLETLPRRDRDASIDRNGVAFVARERTRLAGARRHPRARAPLAPSPRSRELLRGRSRGAAFLGPLTPEAAGDYAAGPSHASNGRNRPVRLTPRNLDFFAHSPSSRTAAGALMAQAELITELARLEGLEAHARAVEGTIK